MGRAPGHSALPRYWRSLAEREQAPAGLSAQDEFPDGSSEWWGGEVTRRQFLGLMGASLAMAGLSGCGRRPEAIVPYVNMPEGLVPGKPLYYATASLLGGVARPVLVESHLGRPTKVEGHPGHPAGLRGTDIFMQATVLELYDPDRSAAVTSLGAISTWDAFEQTIKAQRAQWRRTGGQGLRLLTATVTSPTLTDQIHRLLAEFPRARWHQYEPVNKDAIYAGAEMAFGMRLEPVYDFTKAAVVVSLGANFMAAEPAGPRYARDFIAGRKSYGQDGRMSRLYVAEPMPTVTGSTADHRLPLRPSEINAAAAYLAGALGVEQMSDGAGLSAKARRWLDAAAGDLRQAGPMGLVVAGGSQDSRTHALAHAINSRLGSVDSAVRFVQPLTGGATDQAASLRDLVAAMAAGEVGTLIIVGANPLYEVPEGVGFREAMDKVPLRVHAGLYDDETAFLSHWHLPLAHELESWGDARCYDGSVALMQPLIEPLYGGRTATQLLATLLGEAAPEPRTILRQYWRSQGVKEEADWLRAVHDGWVPGAAHPTVVIPRSRVPSLSSPARPAAAAHQLELHIAPDPSIYDGRYANNPWLQEVPKPITKVAWGNAVHLAPATARALGLENEQVAEVSLADGTVRAPVWIVPGHAERCATLHLGFGRQRAGRVGANVGFGIGPLGRLWADAPMLAQVRATGQKQQVACTVWSQSLHGRDVLKVTTPRGVRTAGDHHEPERSPPSLYPAYDYSKGEQWGMVIDMTACIGCNACVTACQAENTTPTVGKEQVAKGRHMYWIRIDQYFEGDPADPAIHNQPVTCMQCEQAPCEVVCPVGATVHTHDGLNAMVYNRCIGTRYCSNNCPYKVRRFNFLEFVNRKDESLKMQRNPDVTVRSRGVMEKCTYCVQRIQEVRIEAEKQKRPIRDGEVLTACQQACPTEAITFGNLNDPGSKLVALRKLGHHFSMLDHELGTRPRTTYLAKVVNAVPALEGRSG